MLIQLLEVSGVTALLLNGELDFRVRDELLPLAAELCSQPSEYLVIDLSGVTQIYTTGVRLLQEIDGAARRNGRRILLCGFRPFVREFFHMVAGNCDLLILPDLETAVEWVS